MKKIINVLLITLFIFTSCSKPVEEADPIAQIKQSLIQSDILQKVKIYSQIKEQKDNLIKLKLNHDTKCKESVLQCKKKYNYEKCREEIPLIERLYFAKINQTNDSQILSDKTHCDQLDNAYQSNNKILLENIDKTKNIITLLKKQINEKKNNKTSIEDITSFLETKKTQKKSESFLQKTMLEQVINNFGKMFASSFIQISPIVNHEVNMENYKHLEFSQIQEKINKMKDINDQITFLQRTLKTFVQLLTDFENGHAELEETYNDSIIQCLERMEKAKTKVPVYLNEEDTKSIDENLNQINEELKTNFERICLLREKNYHLCEELENHCKNYEEEFQLEIDEIDDLLVYFQKNN